MHIYIYVPIYLSLSLYIYIYIHIYICIHRYINTTHTYIYTYNIYIYDILNHIITLYYTHIGRGGRAAPRARAAHRHAERGMILITTILILLTNTNHII